MLDEVVPDSGKIRSSLLGASNRLHPRVLKSIARRQSNIGITLNELFDKIFGVLGNTIPVGGMDWFNKNYSCPILSSSKKTCIQIVLSE
jgi:hypothetical protein